MSAQGNVEVYARVEDLLTGSLMGDAAALAELYDETAPRVLGIVSAVLGPGPAAEEVTVRVYEAVWTRDELAPAGAGLPWLIDLARRTAIAHQRSRVPRQRGAGDRPATPRVDPGWMPELTDQERAALDLLYLRGLSTMEADEQLGWLPGTSVLTAQQAMLHLAALVNGSDQLEVSA